MGSVLPEGWKQVCTKGHTTEHSTRCTHWISPQGRRYKEWGDVQAYFQLLYFEEDIPGLECRPENAKKFEDVEEEEEVTLEEATKKEMEEKSKKVNEGKAKDLKRKRVVAPVKAKESSESEDEVEPVALKKKGKKKKDEDDDYQPDVDTNKTMESAEETKKSPKKTTRVTRRSIATTKVETKESFKCNQCKSVFLSGTDLQTHMKSAHKVKDVINTTLDETPDVPKKSDKVVPMSKKPEQQVAERIQYQLLRRPRILYQLLRKPRFLYPLLRKSRNPNQL
eukprot:GFUD01116706.1.p1 GENE.GFUD01116706.1~~GFUD01116706.1.p1  ORF type:complete len:290 (-),score=83.23 GFUD01116706.1:1079-1918(-)